MKHLFKTITLLLISVTSILQLAAAPITQQQAQQNVQTFLESKGMATKASTLRLSKPKFTSTDIEYYYVFNIGDKDGYVIAAGDDCAPVILGYADSGSVDMDSIPENMLAWLEEYANQIQYLQDHEAPSFHSFKASAVHEAIPPLMATTWGQDDPYNQNCPDFFGNGKCITGCVATAMAQVMYFHRANSVTQTTTPIPAYYCRTQWVIGSDTLQIHVDSIPAGSPIDWDNLLDSYGEYSTTTQQQAVANLMKYCGAAVQMNYGTDASSAPTANVPDAMKAYFNYCDETTLKRRTDYSTEDWDNLIYNELSNSRPVFYTGTYIEPGYWEAHAFVCDGYDGCGYYHINWGWTGSSDGYFLLSALNPIDDFDFFGYNSMQTALINAQPKSSSPSNPVLATSISLNKTSVTVTEGNILQLTATVLPTNATNRTVTWKSSNTSVATVSSSGLVTARSPGSATITATTTDGTNLSANCSVTVESSSPQSSIISFVDANVKTLCVQNWDTNGDGEFSTTEAASVTNLGTVFKSNKNITSFNELQYFTGLTSIDEYAFYYCSGLTSVTIPNSVMSIGINAFDACRGLTSLTIPNSVTSIGKCAFRDCSGLAVITVESGNTTFDSRNYCNAIIETASNTLIAGCKATVIPNSVTSIGEYAFYGCSGLTSVTIPNSVTSIGWSAFDYCSGLKRVNITDLKAWCNIQFSNNYSNPLDYAHHLYLNDSELTDLMIPNTVTSIGKYAFYGCSGLTSVTIPSFVTSIGYIAFSGCSGLRSIIVESGNSTYDSRNDCNAIIETASNTLIAGCKATVIPNSVTSIGINAFYGCSGLTRVTIPNTVTTINNYAFSGCSGLTSVTIPNSVTSIGWAAFSSCSGLTSVIIPNSVTSIAGSAFEACSGLNDVFSFINDLTTVSLGSYVFLRYYPSYTERTLHVPFGTSAAYQADTNWSKYFGSIVEMELDPVLAESIKLNVTTAGLNEGATLQLTATVLPEECDNKTVLWASDNPSVATVDSNGLVTTHSVGTATITANTTDGSNLSTACTVTLLPVGVKGDVNGDNGITISDVTSLIDYLLTGHWPEP